MFNMLASAKLGLLCALYGMNIWYFCEVCMSPAYPQRKLGATEHQTTYINDAFQFLSWTTTCICTPYNMWNLYCNVVFCACGHLCFCFWFYIIVPLLWGDQLLVLFLWAWYTSWTRSWNVWLFASSSSSPMLRVYNQSLASIGTRPSHMEEGLVPIPVSDWLCTVLDYSNRMHILHNYFLLRFRASSFKTNHLHEIMCAQKFVPTKCLVCHCCIQVSPFKGS